MEKIPEYYSSDEAHSIPEEHEVVDVAHFFVDKHDGEGVNVFGTRKERNERDIVDETLVKHGVNPDAYAVERSDTSFSPSLRRLDEIDTGSKSVKKMTNAKAKNSKRI